MGLQKLYNVWARTLSHSRPYHKVDFMCQFGLRDAQIPGKTLFLDVSVRVSPEDISI